MSLDKKLPGGKVTLISPDGYKESEKKTFLGQTDEEDKVCKN